MVETIDMVNHPSHYISDRGPKVVLDKVVSKIHGGVYWVECIDIIRHIKDPRLFTAMKYIWRVAFGGKGDDDEDIRKAIFYLNDWRENKVS